MLDARRRRFILASLMLAMFLSAMEGTIVATAMPTIIGDLGGFSLFAWVFSLFLLAQVATIPIYGRLADVYGRKRVFTVGIIIFLVGSLLCGLSHSMIMLIISRAVQGIGAGAVQPIATTIVGDIYSLEERARVQGYISSVWALASVIGPSLGGLIVDTVGWAWVFWINVPIGILATLGVEIFHHEHRTSRKHSIDWLGSFILMVGTSALILALVQGGVAWAWTSWPIIVSIAVFVVFTILFILRERVAKEPILPLRLMKQPTIGFANLLSLIIGGVTYGISSFTPTFAQGVLGTSSFVAGLTIATLSIGWPIAATFSGKIIIGRGYRFTAVLGMIIIVFATVVYASIINPSISPWALAAATTLFGFGLGFASNASLLAVQTSVTYMQRGVATGANMFARTLGSSLFVAVLSSVMNSEILHQFTLAAKNPTLSQQLGKLGGHLEVTNTLLNVSTRSHLAPSVLHFLGNALTFGIDHAYWWLLVITVIGLVFAWMMPKGIPSEDERKGDAPQMATEAK